MLEYFGTVAPPVHTLVAHHLAPDDHNTIKRYEVDDKEILPGVDSEWDLTVSLIVVTVGPPMCETVAARAIYDPFFNALESIWGGFVVLAPLNACAPETAAPETPTARPAHPAPTVPRPSRSPTLAAQGHNVSAWVRRITACPAKSRAAQLSWCNSYISKKTKQPSLSCFWNEAYRPSVDRIIRELICRR